MRSRIKCLLPRFDCRAIYVGIHVVFGVATLGFVPCPKVLGAVTKAFSAVLAHMDRNSGLRLLQGGTMLCDTWVELFKVTTAGRPGSSS